MDYNKMQDKALCITELNNEQIEYICQERMTRDFPPEELRPAALIIEKAEEERYTCLGLIDESNPEEILGYAFYAKTGKKYLLDYLAILDSKRNSGYGTAMLELAQKKFADCQAVIVEVEDPEFAANEEEGRQRRRRIDFYLRNGYVDTGMKVLLFGVDYIILELRRDVSSDRDKLSEFYLDIYRYLLPENLFEGNVDIK